MNEAMDAIEARARQQLDRLRELAEQMSAIRIRASSPDEAIVAEVDGNGALRHLELSAAIATLSPREFERLLVATAGQAAQLAFSRRAELVSAFNRQVAGDRRTSI